MKTIQKNLTTVNREKKSRRTIKYIVVHYTANNGDTAGGNSRYFKDVYRGASAHYFVDDYNIVQSVEDKDVAWAVGANKYTHKDCRNSNSISVEMCSRIIGGRYVITDMTQQNAAELCAYLLKKYKLSTVNLLRHYDVTGKKCPAPFVDDVSQWYKFKKEVGDIMEITETSININGKNKTVERVLINGNNFIKLRDLSDILNIGYDKNTKQVSVTTK